MARQAGMTLIELTVVLLVLVGLAGLLIPYVSGFVGKTHDATGSSNIQALNNAIGRYSVEHYDNFPNEVDSLIEDGTGTVYSKMMSSIMPGMPASGGGQYLTGLQLTADSLASLKDVGINSVRVMDPLLDNATFGNTVAASLPLAVGAWVAELDSSNININSVSISAAMGRRLDIDNNHYIVFGLGDDSTITGTTLSDVPVHFSQNGDMGANNAYNHFVTVYEVPRADHCAGATDVGGVLLGTQPATEPLCIATVTLTAGGTSKGTWHPAGAKAKFVGAAMAMGMGNFEGLGESLNRYYENTAAN